MKNVEFNALCYVTGCDCPVAGRWNGRYYCAKHDPFQSGSTSAPTKQPKSKAERAKKTKAQQRWRVKLNQQSRERRELMDEKDRLEIARKLERSYTEVQKLIQSPEFHQLYEAVTGTPWDRSIEGNRTEVVSRVATFLLRRDTVLLR